MVHSATALSSGDSVSLVWVARKGTRPVENEHPPFIFCRRPGEQSADRLEGFPGLSSLGSHIDAGLRVLTSPGAQKQLANQMLRVCAGHLGSPVAIRRPSSHGGSGVDP